MTIAAPNRNRQLAYTMRWLMVGIVSLCIVSIGLYNRTNELKRGISEKAKIVEVSKLKNAELKNAFYAAIDTKALVSAGQRLGYVRDNNPSYLTLYADGTAPQDGSSVSLKSSD